MSPRAGKFDIMTADISFDLERLYDPYNFDHILPLEKRLAFFKQRNLPHIKHYKAAVKIFGGPPKRTRAIEAPPMETPLKHRLGLYFHQPDPVPPIVLNGPLKPAPEPIKKLTTEEKEQTEINDKTVNYKNWINERQKLRNNLNGLALTEAMLARKTDKTELEKRVQSKFKADREWKPESPPPREKTPSPKPAPDIPTMNVPPPDGLQILDKFLSLNRMRLIDLFKITDKDKSWSLSRTEMLNAVSQSAIPISEGEIDDMFIALDANLDEELNFQELNKGLMQWRRQRRGIKKNSLDDSTQKTSEKDTHSIPYQPAIISRHDCEDKQLIKRGSRETLEKPLSQSLSRENTELSKTSKSSQIKESSFSEKSHENLHQEKTDSSSYLVTPKSREKSFVSSTKQQTVFEDSASNSYHQRVKIMDGQTSSSELSRHDTAQTDTQTEKSLFEDVLFQSEETPKAFENIKESDFIEDEKLEVKTSVDMSAKPESQKAGTSHSDGRSRTSTPNSLEPPEFDTTRTESRAPESAEAMLDIRKHDRVVLSRNTIRRNLSRDKRVTFDELPGVIKVGYKPIDDHCSDSTIGGEAAAMVNQFRQEKLREYFEVKKIFEEKGIPMTAKTLDRVLLYPGDRPVHVLKKDLATPLGPLTDQFSPFNKPKPKKKPPKRRRSFVNRVAKTSETGGGNGQANAAETDGNGSASSKRSLIAVEDVYPLASSVAPKVYKESLSSGRALISRKVDNWMTFEEYSKYTEHLPNRFCHFNRPSNPATVWPGYMLDKIRLNMATFEADGLIDGRGQAIKNRDSCAYEGLGTGLYNGQGHAVFHNTSQTKLAYPGYNNDLLTWPVGPNGVRYGNIDEHRIIK